MCAIIETGKIIMSEPVTTMTVTISLANNKYANRLKTKKNLSEGSSSNKKKKEMRCEKTKAHHYAINAKY